ncbi:MAG: ComF family protein [Candidatus Levybacteria bacterium]|nr:ComF family protein [Candidatus Levybacteria bacterium]
MKKLLYQFKYKPFVKDLKDMLTELFIDRLLQHEVFQSLLATNKYAVFTSVPLHDRRQKERGYNHAELLAKALALYFQKPYVSCLVRVKPTITQVGLAREERKENIKNAFILKENLKSPSEASTLFIVDDIVTTGATFLEAAKVLKRQGIKKVYGLALAGEN